MRFWSENRLPSKEYEAFWFITRRMHYFNLTDDVVKNRGFGGKWLIFCNVNDVDVTWKIISDATANGLLGIESKVATSRPSRFQKAPDSRVICVYTSDHENEKDVMRVRKVLRDLGFREKLLYKTDEATRLNKEKFKYNRK